MSCWCKRSEATILDHLKAGSFPPEALRTHCCWKRICQVYGFHFKEVDEDDWQAICRQRGNVLTLAKPEAHRRGLTMGGKDELKGSISIQASRSVPCPFCR